MYRPIDHTRDSTNDFSGLQTNLVQFPRRSPLPPFYRGPSFSSILGPCSCHSCFEIHMFSLSAMMFASTAPPRNTICLLLGGSSILTLNLLNRSGFPCS